VEHIVVIIIQLFRPLAAGNVMKAALDAMLSESALKAKRS